MLHGLVQIRSVHQLHSSLTSLRGWFRCILTEVSLIFCLAFCAADANNARLSYVATRSPLARAPFVLLFFDLNSLIENGNLQVYMYCLHA